MTTNVAHETRQQAISDQGTVEDRRLRRALAAAQQEAATQRELALAAARERQDVVELSEDRIQPQGERRIEPRVEPRVERRIERERGPRVETQRFAEEFRRREFARLGRENELGVGTTVGEEMTNVTHASLQLRERAARERMREEYLGQFLDLVNARSGGLWNDEEEGQRKWAA